MVRPIRLSALLGVCVATLLVASCSGGGRGGAGGGSPVLGSGATATGSSVSSSTFQYFRRSSFSAPAVRTSSSSSVKSAIAAVAGSSARSSVRLSSSSVSARSSSRSSVAGKPLPPVSSTRRVYDLTAPAATGNAEIQIAPDRREATAGGLIGFTVTVRNASKTALKDVPVVFSFSPAQLTIVKSDGKNSVDTVQWTIKALGAGQKRALRVSVRVTDGQPVLETIRVSATATVGGAELSASSDLSLLTSLPNTGPGDFAGPLENTRRFLSPYGSSPAAAIPAIVWAATILCGLGLGVRAARRFI